jgi:hypothetical protein
MEEIKSFALLEMYSGNENCIVFVFAKVSGIELPSKGGRPVSIA